MDYEEEDRPQRVVSSKTTPAQIERRFPSGISVFASDRDGTFEGIAQGIAAVQSLSYCKVLYRIYG